MLAFASHVDGSFTAQVFQRAIGSLGQQKANRRFLAITSSPHQERELIFKRGVHRRASADQLKQALTAAVAGGINGGVLLDAVDRINFCACSK